MRPWRLFCVSALIAASMTGSGCSTNYQIGSMFGKDDDKAAHATGAVPTVGHALDDGLPPASDLAYAKVAATEVLSRGGKDSSLPWENPASGARGTVTPLANSYRMEGALCRDFLASYVAEGSESWLQGEACRAAKGQWEVRRLKPWRRS